MTSGRVPRPLILVGALLRCRGLVGPLVPPPSVLVEGDLVPGRASRQGQGATEKEAAGRAPEHISPRSPFDLVGSDVHRRQEARSGRYATPASSWLAPRQHVGHGEAPAATGGERAGLRRQPMPADPRGTPRSPRLRPDFASMQQRAEGWGSASLCVNSSEHPNMQQRRRVCPS